MTPRDLSTGPFVFAILTALALVLSAPFVGQIRSAVRSAFPGHYVLIVAGAAAVGLAGALAAAAWRIRQQRAARYGAIALAIFIAVSYSLWTASPSAERNAVERFHFLQYGLVAYLFYRAWRPLGDGSIFVLPLLAGLMMSAAEEWLQWFIPNRVGEIKDVLLNLVAVFCGLLFSVGFNPPPRLTLAVSAGNRPRVAAVGVAALLALALFFHVVHLGHVITDPEIGSFTTRFSPERLGPVQEERATRWASSPPPITLVRLSREDQYLSEGMEHVRERNELWAAGDIRGAWLENRILEKYFAPVLRTPSHEGTGHAWPDSQRRDAEGRAAEAGTKGAFVSAAYPYRIYSWPRNAFWAVMILLGAAALVAGNRRERTTHRHG